MGRITAREKTISTRIGAAHAKRTCLVGTTKADRRALSRRVASGRLRRVFPCMFADATYWDALNPMERTLHIIRTLAIKHPDWVFAGLSAASIHGFDYRWGLHDGNITVLTARRRNDLDSTHVRRVFASHCTTVVIDGVRVTNVARTIIDCASRLAFRDALPIFDGAFAAGMTAEQVLAECARIDSDHTAVLRLLHYAVSNSENGGESLARGTIIEEGFSVPEIQVTFVDAQTEKKYRADFVWRLDDGRVIVGEFDGRAKYMDASMTGGEDPMHVFQDERDREDVLRRNGVTKVIRFTYKDVIGRRVLVQRLIEAGVPRIRERWSAV